MRAGHALEVADVNGDGRDDVLELCVRAGVDEVAIRLQALDGDLALAVPVPLPPGTTPGRQALHVADVDGDGDADLLVANRDHGLVVVRGR